MYNPNEGMSMQEIFHKYLPDTLYASHYSLSQMYGFTPQEWRTFLRDNHMFIDTELAAIAEAEARSALSRLGNATGTEVAAIKALLETSKLINDSQKQNTKVVMTFIPSSKEEEKDVNDNTNPRSVRDGVDSVRSVVDSPARKEEEEKIDPFAGF